MPLIISSSCGDTSEGGFGNKKAATGAAYIAEL